MRPKIVLFGDSITEESFKEGGWGAAIAHQFSRTADVVLRGYSGYNTRWALHVVDRIFPSTLPDPAPLTITIFFGANDASLPDRSSAFQHVPLHEYKQNLLTLVSLFKKRWAPTLIILITPPPIDEEGRLRHPYGENFSGLPERTNEAAGSYAKACIAVGHETGVPVLDIWSKLQQIPEWEKAYLWDGLHLTADGNRVVFEEVVEILKKHGLTPETLPADLPLIFDLDQRDPLKSFEIRDVGQQTSVVD